MNLFNSIVLLLLCFSGMANGQTVKVSYFELPPHGHQVKGTNSGAAIEVLKDVFKLIHRSYKIEQKPLSRIIRQHDDDVVAFLAKSPEREKVFSFTDTPLFRLQGVLVVSKSSLRLKTVKNFSELSGAKIGHWAEGFRSPNLDNLGIHFVPFYNHEVERRAILSVTQGRLDAFYSPDKENIKFILSQNKDLTSLVDIVDLPEPTNGLYLVFKKDINTELRAQISKALGEILSRKKYEDYLAAATAL